jgi:hypothetical protein
MRVEKRKNTNKNATKCSADLHSRFGVRRLAAAFLPAAKHCSQEERTNSEVVRRTSFFKAFFPAEN